MGSPSQRQPAPSRTRVRWALPGAGANISAWGSANQNSVFDFKEPIVIGPGMGLIVVNQTVNLHILASFDFYEFTQ